MNKNDSRLRPIPGFPDYYVEEKLGNIWSFKRYKDGRILKPHITGRSKKLNTIRTASAGLYINGKLYMRAIGRLVMNVTDPKITVDHKDRNIWNNKKKNLRKANKSQQQQNKAPYSKTGFKGVYIHGSGFRAQIYTDGAIKNLGTYSNIFEAAAVRNLATCKHHGKFAVYNEVNGYILTL